MNKKQAFQQIRHLAKRGSNEMLERKVNEIFQAGFEAGMAALSEELKGRINDHQSTDSSNDSNGVGGKSDSAESCGSGGVTTNDSNSSERSPNPALNAESSESV